MNPAIYIRSASPEDLPGMLEIYRPYVEKTTITFGTALYRCLIRLLTLQGFLYAHALVTLPNQNSMRLHNHMGFCKVCVNENVGFKLGVWRDVAELCLPLAELPKIPAPPCPYNTLSPEAVVPIFREEAAKIAFP